MASLDARLREAIAVNLERSGYVESAWNAHSEGIVDAIMPAIMGQLGDVIGAATEAFSHPELLRRGRDLTPYTILGTQQARVAELREQVCGDADVPPRRFFVCAREVGQIAVEVTFCRFEVETIARTDLDKRAWDMLDPQWPEVRAVVETMQAAIAAKSNGS